MRTSTLAAGLALALCAGAPAGPASAAPQTAVVDFAEDGPRGPVPNGFTSADADFLSFSDTIGEHLVLADWGNQSNGVGLAVEDDFDRSGLRMQLRRPSRSISFAFGNDDPGWSRPGDAAVLTLYLKGRQVGTVSVVMNRDDLMNQRISYAGHPFDSAVFLYDVRDTPATGLIEIVDDLHVGRT